MVISVCLVRLKPDTSDYQRTNVDSAFSSQKYSWMSSPGTHCSVHPPVHGRV